MAVIQGPVEFHRAILHRKLWGKQKEILDAITTHRSVSVKGCHGSGKTYAIAGLVPYDVLAAKESIVLTLAPTLRQVKTHWNEVHAAINSMPRKLGDLTTTDWKLGPNNYAKGFSSSKGVNAQGFHGKRVLIIADEAIGISGDVWDAIEGIRAGGDVRLIKLCNPTVPNGPVYDDFTKNRAVPGHKCITISAFDTPNLAGLTMESLLRLPEEELDIAPYPWLTRRRWVVEMFHKWGPTNPRFLSRVLGEFPTQATDAVFQLSWIEAAGKPYEQDDLRPLLKPGLYIQVGIDVAGPGDDETTACARIGAYIVATGAWVKADPLDEVLQFLGALQMRFPGAALVIVGDTVGIGYHFLRAISRHKYDVRAFVAGGVPVDPTTFRNAKAEAYWTTREWMKDGFVRGVTDEDTQAQLSDVRYSETPKGLIEIEHKDDARARGSSSPDRAEALILAFMKITLRQQTFEIGEGSGYQISPV
jgi:hypothetical protein